MGCEDYPPPPAPPSNFDGFPICRASFPEEIRADKVRPIGYKVNFGILQKFSFNISL
jgi:hypothetical protein